MSEHSRDRTPVIPSKQSDATEVTILVLLAPDKLHAMNAEPTKKPKSSLEEKIVSDPDMRDE